MVWSLLWLAVVSAGFAAHWWLSRRSREAVWFVLRPAGGAPELEHVVQHAVSAAGRLDGSLTVVVLRTRDGVIPYVGVGSDGDSGAVHAFAASVSAVAERADRPPALVAGVMVVGCVNAKRPFAGATSNKGDTGHASKVLADALTGFGDWVAVVARPQSPRELVATRTWYAHLEDGPPVQNHPSCAKGAMVAELWAAGPQLQVAGHHMNALTQSLAGFDVLVSGRAPSLARLRALWVLAGAAGVALAAATGAGVLAVVFASAAALVPQVLLFSRGDRFGWLRRAARLRAGAPLAPRPLSRVWHPGYRKEKRNADGTLNRFEVNDYPLGDHRVPLGAQHVAMAAAPLAGAASGAVVAVGGELPVALSEPGVFAGVSVPDGAPVRLPDHAPRTIMLFGAAGGGKSEALRNVFAHDCARRQAGESRAVVVLESQGGAEVAKWAAIAERFGVGDALLVADIGDPSTPSIDMFAGDGTPHMRAGNFLHMFFASDELDQGGVSLTPALQALLAAAMVVTPEVAASAGVAFGSVPWLASVLAGGQAGGDATGLRLWGELVAAARAAELEAGADEATVFSPMALPRTHMGDSVIRLRSYFDKNLKDREREFAAPQRRLADLLSIDSWFAHDRPRFSWAELLAAGRVVVLNHGDPADPSLAGLDARWVERLSNMLLAGVEVGIRASCRGWADEGRRVSVIADELSIVAKASPATPDRLRQQFRKYGVDLAFATQAEYQLEPGLLKSVLGFGIVCWLQLGGEPGLLDLARQYLANDVVSWDERVAKIPPFHTIVCATAASVRQPAVLVKMVPMSSSPVDDVVGWCGLAGAR